MCEIWLIFVILDAQNSGGIISNISIEIIRSNTFLKNSLPKIFIFSLYPLRWSGDEMFYKYLYWIQWQQFGSNSIVAFQDVDRKLIRIKLKAFVIKINCTKSTRLSSVFLVLVNHIIRHSRQVRRHTRIINIWDG